MDTEFILNLIRANERRLGNPVTDERDTEIGRFILTSKYGGGIIRNEHGGITFSVSDKGKLADSHGLAAGWLEKNSTPSVLDFMSRDNPFGTRSSTLDFGRQDSILPYR